MSRPIAPKVSGGVGRAGTSRCGGSGGATLSGACSCALAKLTQASNATTVLIRCMAAIIFNSNGNRELLRIGRGENEELEHAVNDHEAADQGGRRDCSPQSKPLFDNFTRP